MGNTSSGKPRSAFLTDGHTYISQRWVAREASAIAYGLFPFLKRGANRRVTAALAACEQTIQQEPQNASAYSHKGDLLRELKRYEEALVAYESALQLDPEHAAAYTGKGVALERLGRESEALAAYEQARAIGTKQLEHQAHQE